jgi:hypothetical protein
VAEICRKAGISQATYFAWKKKFDGLLPTEMRRLKQLEDENARLTDSPRPQYPAVGMCCPHAHSRHHSRQLPVIAWSAPLPLDRIMRRF